MSAQAQSITRIDSRPGPCQTRELIVPQFRPRSNSFRIEVVTEIDRLESLRAAWTELAEAAVEKNIFYEPFLALPGLRHLSDGQRWEFVLVYAQEGKNEEVLCGLFPLSVQNSFHSFPVTVVELWRHMHCFLCTPLVHRDCAFEVVGTFLDWLEHDSGSRLMKFGKIRADGPFYQALISNIYIRSLPHWVSVNYVRAMMERADSAEDYLDRVISTKRMGEYRRQTRRLSEKGELTFEVLSDPADLDTWLEDFLRIEGSGWKGENGSALCSSTAYQSFFEEAIRGASAEGKLDMLAARLDGEVIAQKCNFVSGPEAFGFKIGFNESLRPYSPGVLLEIENIRQFHQQSAVNRVDSCAEPNHPMIDHLWSERRLIQSVLIGTGEHTGGLFVALAPLLRWLKRRVVSEKRIHK